MSTVPAIVFFGSDPICLPALDYLRHEAADQCSVRAVVSQPHRRQGRGKHLKPNPVAAWALAHGVELLQPEKPTRELADWIVAQQISVTLVMAYGHFLSKSLREAARYGMLNLHGSLLPKYRGASPIETALACGEIETGVGLMQVIQAMDAGGVADVERVRIGETDTGADLRVKIGEAVVPLLRRNLAALLSGHLQFTAQEVNQATYCRKIHKADAAVDFALPARAIYNRLRAFNPWPGAYFDHGAIRLKVGRASVQAEAVEVAAPGTVLRTQPGLCVATGAGVICFHALQRAGARMLPVAEFLRGYRIVEGDQLVGGRAQALLREPA